jgi:hypothetical protein
VIDWFSVGANALWIIGAAIIVATFSFANWLAHVRDQRTRHLLGTAAFQIPFAIGLLLISLGLLLVSRGWLEHVLWAFLSILFLWQLWVLWRGS